MHQRSASSGAMSDSRSVAVVACDICFVEGRDIVERSASGGRELDGAGIVTRRRLDGERSSSTAWVPFGSGVRARRALHAHVVCSVGGKGSRLKFFSSQPCDTYSTTLDQAHVAQYDKS